MIKTTAPLSVIPINGRVVGHTQELHPGDIIDRVVFVPIPNKTGTMSQLQPCVQQALWRERSQHYEALMSVTKQRWYLTSRDIITCILFILDVPLLAMQPTDLSIGCMIERSSNSNGYYTDNNF